MEENSRDRRAGVEKNKQTQNCTHVLGHKHCLLHVYATYAESAMADEFVTNVQLYLIDVTIMMIAIIK